MPTQPTLLGPTDFRDMPWKNGGGTTRELLRLPHPARPDDFALRLSIATVAQGGPFSTFPGIDRTLMLLEGEGMALQFGSGRQATLDQALRPINFAGEEAVDCRLLGGALRDFNVMVARDWARTATRILQLAADESLHWHSEQASWIYVHTGSMRCGSLNVEAAHLLALPQGDHSLLAVSATTAIAVSLKPR